MVRVLVVATSRKTRGGITAVIKQHEKGEQWKKYHCVWIQTHRDGTALVKLWYFFSAFCLYMLLLPFCDIVHFHFSERTSAKRKCLMMPLAKMMGKKIIAHFHAYSVDSTIKSSLRNRYKYLFSTADRCIVLSEFWRNALVEELGISPDKITVLYNPCPEVTLNRENSTSINIKEKEILYAGTVNHRKGYDDMIKAFARIAYQYPDWKIVFAGNGEIEQGKALAVKLGIVHQVVFLGWVSGENKDQAFRRAMAFCLPSYAEGFPMGVLDAWAYGLPVITTPVGGIPDIAEDGKNLLLFNPGDVETLAKQMEKIICDEQLRISLAEESVRLSTTIFNVQTINKQLARICEELS